MLYITSAAMHYCWAPLNLPAAPAPQRAAHDVSCRPLRKALGNGRWAIPLIHGFWQQRTLSLLGQTLTLTVVSRRSKHFAGTRSAGCSLEGAKLLCGHLCVHVQALLLAPCLLWVTAVLGQPGSTGAP